MTDARFPDRWLNDRRLSRLSDADFRSFVTALTWSVSNRTDGRIEADDLALIPGFREQSIAGLTSAGVWTYEADCWQIEEFSTTQTSKTQLEGLDHKRHQDRERQARKRARDQGQEPPPSRDSRPDVTRDTKARPGQASTGTKNEAPTNPSGHVSLDTGEVLVEDEDAEFSRWETTA